MSLSEIFDPITLNCGALTNNTFPLWLCMNEVPCLQVCSVLFCFLSTRMYGNPQVCGASSAFNNPICVPQEYSSLIEDDITNVTAVDSSNCSCTPPDVPGPFLGSNSPCNCVQPIIVGFQLKSPSFLLFDAFSEAFLSWLTAGLDLSLSQVSIQDAQWVGPRLQMTLLLLPEVGVFNVTEFNRLYGIFSQWKILDNPVLGPYELLFFYPRTPPG